MKKIECYCLFDITPTGITSQRNVPLPCVTHQGVTIADQNTLNFARNQQRNYDTLIHLIGMRTQIFNIEAPTQDTESHIFGKNLKCWRFSFEIEPQAQWLVDQDEFWILKNDSDGTPMILGLDESAGLEPVLDATGAQPNIIYHASHNK